MYIDFKTIEWEPRRWPDDDFGPFNNEADYTKGRDDFFEAFYMTGDPDFINDKRAFGWVHNRSSYWYNKLTGCENTIIQTANSNSNPDDNIVSPNDDDDFSIETLQSGSSNKKNRKIRLENLSLFQRFDIDWFDPYTGAHLTTTDETHSFLGKLRVTLPEEINTTQFKDLVFLLRPKNSSFMNPFQQVIEANSNNDSLSLSNTDSENELILDTLASFNKLIIYPNPTNNTVMVNAGEKILKIEIYSILGVKMHDIILNDKYAIVNFNAFPKGVYTMKVFCERHIFNERVIFQ